MRKQHIVKINGEDVKINTNFDYPPIPVRGMDWSATTDDYEPGDAIGNGETEELAIADLLSQLEE